MSRFYTAIFTGTLTTAGADTDLVSVQAADDKPVKLRGLLLSQISEVGDAMEEGVRITIRRMPATFTVGTGGTAVTPNPMDSADVACGATVRCNDTSVSTTSGTALILAEIGWNIRNSPYELWFPDAQLAPLAKQGEGLVVRLETTLADDITACLTFWLEE